MLAHEDEDVVAGVDDLLHLEGVLVKGAKPAMKEPPGIVSAASHRSVRNLERRIELNRTIEDRVEGFRVAGSLLERVPQNLDVLLRYRLPLEPGGSKGLLAIDVELDARDLAVAHPVRVRRPSVYLSAARSPVSVVAGDDEDPIAQIACLLHVEVIVALEGAEPASEPLSDRDTSLEGPGLGILSRNDELDVIGVAALARWARLVSNQRPLACEAVSPQARMGVVRRLDVRGCAAMCADVR